MEQVTVVDWYDRKKSGMSISIDSGTLYIHFSPHHTIDRIYTDKWGNSADFWHVMNYALTHEEMHLTFNKIGEDFNLVDHPLVSWAIEWSLGLCFDVQLINRKEDVK